MICIDGILDVQDLVAAEAFVSSCWSARADGQSMQDYLLVVRIIVTVRLRADKIYIAAHLHAVSIRICHIVPSPADEHCVRRFRRSRRYPFAGTFKSAR